MTQTEPIVLLVDEDSAVRDALKFALELEGIRVAVCSSGRELLMHPDLRRACCLIVNSNMSAMDGFEVLEHLAAIEVQAPVILIAGEATPSLQQRARDAGVRHILEMPLLDSALSDSIHDILVSPSVPPDAQNRPARKPN
jgi:FixJ family two-component response regulator